MSTATGEAKETPLLFRDELIREIFAGRKWMTRRIAKLNHAGRVARGGRNWHPADLDAVKACPYGGPGDRIWVKEAFRLFYTETPRYPKTPANSNFLYRANHESLRVPVDLFDDERYTRLRRWQKKHPYAWRSPLLMFQEAARLWLEITEVRLERVQRITEAEAIAEGVSGDALPQLSTCELKLIDWPLYDYERPAASRFAGLWNSINRERGKGWETDPLVWVIRFRIAEAPTSAKATADGPPGNR